MLLGYNTNGMAHHDPFDAIRFLADTGYQAIGITVDHGWISHRDWKSRIDVQRLKSALTQTGLTSVIETGARFLLDPRKKHEPTLLSSNAGLRIEFLKYCIDLAAELDSRCVSIWSGITPDGCNTHEAMETLARNLAPVLQHAEDRNVDIGFEPEPGMLIDTTGRFERLLHLIDSPRLKMTMDIGHLLCMSEVPIATYLEKFADHIVNVHIEDMVAGTHEHLMFGDGEIHFPPVIEALKRIGYEDGIYVELSRHSHAADVVVPAAFEFLSPMLNPTPSS